MKCKLLFALAAWFYFLPAYSAEPAGEKVVPPCNLTLQISGDTTICAGDSIQLSATTNAPNIYWSPSLYLDDPTSPNPTAVVYNSTLFIATAYDSMIQCFVYDSVWVEVSALITSAAVTHPSCNGNDGSIIMGATGNGPFTYNWSNGATSSMNGNLTDGTYCVTVTNATGCTTTNCYTLTQENFHVTINPQNVTLCSGGVVTTQHFSNTLGTYSTVWNPSTGISNVGPNHVIFSPTTTTTYVGTFTDSITACVSTDSITITVGTMPTINGWGDTIVCDSAANIPLHVSTNASSVIWGPTGLLDDPNSFHPIAHAGSTTSFNVTAIDSVSGCTATDYVQVIVENIIVSANVTPASCQGNDGSIDVAVTGNFPPYNYLWSTNNTNPDIHNLSPGTYCVTITSNSGCTETRCYVISQINFAVSLGATQVSMCSDSNAVISHFAIPQNTAYTVQWTPTNGVLAIGPYYTSFNPTTTTTYVGTFTDTNGCIYVDSVTIIVEPSPVITGIHDTTLCGSNSIQLTASATGVNPQYYWWSPQGTLSTTQSPTTILTTQQSTDVYLYVWDSLYQCSADSVIHVTLDSSCFSLINGSVIGDLNHDCIENSGDFAIPGVMMKANDGTNDFYTFTDPSGDYQFQLAPGTYDITQIVPAGYVQLCPAAGYNVVANAGSTYFGNNFFDTITPVQDLRISRIIVSARPGFERWGDVYIYNDGNIPMNGYLELVLDPDVTPVWGVHGYAVPDSYDPVTHTAIWNFVGLMPGQYGHYHFHYLTPVNQPMGSYLTFDATAYPVAGDVTPGNNTCTDSVLVINSWDPNDKQVAPEGFGTEGNILVDQDRPFYRIRFQNTGTAPAINISVKDTLDAQLDVTSMKLLAYSHQPQVLIENNIITFSFPNIWLPDSGTDFEGSNGFVDYELNIANPQVGDVVTNTASIYFDFNPAVATNTVKNTIVEPTIIEKPELSSLTIYPNPANERVTVQWSDPATSQLIIRNVIGEIIANRAVEGSRSIVLATSGWKPGAYFIELTSGNQSQVKQLMITR